MALTAILDVDGTLVDTNYHHAIAWHRALRAHGHSVEMWKVHRHIGMGGDKIVAALAGEEAESSEGDDIRAAEGEAFGELIGEVEPMQGARELIEALHDDGTTTILASSAKQEEVERYLDLLEARELVDGWTTSADVEETKPAADLVETALRKAGEGPAVMIGDSTWDVKAASKAEVPTLAVLTGGFSEEELRKAGAAEVVESIEGLRRDREIRLRIWRSESQPPPGEEGRPASRARALNSRRPQLAGVHFCSSSSGLRCRASWRRCRAGRGCGHRGLCPIACRRGCWPSDPWSSRARPVPTRPSAPFPC